MPLLPLIIIALVQGISEWLPVSSSGHVLLVADYFSMDGRDELLLNAMAHFGTLFAVLVYFRKDIARAIAGGFELAVGLVRHGSPPADPNARFFALLILSSMPVTIIGIGLYESLVPGAVQSILRNIWSVAGATIVFALALWWADIKGSQQKTLQDMTIRDAALIGALQLVAIIFPGASRSGITMTAARALGFKRTETARFSMLIGAPLLAGAGVYALSKLAMQDLHEPGMATLGDGLVVASLSFVSGMFAIGLLMAVVRRMSFLPFIVYRLALGIGLVLLGTGYMSAEIPSGPA